MNNVDAEARRNFEDMTAHEAQEALEEELHEVVEGEDVTGTEEEAEIAEEEIEADAEATEDAEVEADADEEAANDDDTNGDETGGDETGSDAGGDEVWSAAEMAEHARMAEALLFAAAEPLDNATIASRLPAGADIPSVMEALRQQYENRGINLSHAAGKWRFLTAVDVAHVLEIEKVEQRRLSRAATETLAIIAYHQPCTRADIEDVRGVAVSKGSLDQLMEIGWVKMRGRRKDVPGRPVLYGTSPAFLEQFNLETVSDLPGMADLKAAGLLDARLPPGFVVPSPADGDDEETEENEGVEAEFVQDFHDEDAEEPLED